MKFNGIEIENTHTVICTLFFSVPGKTACLQSLHCKKVTP